MSLGQYRKTLMVVDDSLETRASVFRHAQDLGLSVITADNPHVALASFDHALPDVVLTDLFSSDMGGLSLTRQIRERRPTCPVVIMADVVSEAATIGALRAGAQDYLRKPIHPKELLAAVHRVLVSIPHSLHEATGIERVEHEVVVENDPAHVEASVAALVSSATPAMPESRRQHLRAALHELVLNAVEHGCLEIAFQAKHEALSSNTYERLVAQRRVDAKLKFRRVRVRITHDRLRKRLEFRIADEGKGFGWQDLFAKGTSPVDVTYGCGRGIFLARALFPDLTYNESGNEAILKVSLP